MEKQELTLVVILIVLFSVGSFYFGTKHAQDDTLTEETKNETNCQTPSQSGFIPPIPPILGNLSAPNGSFIPPLTGNFSRAGIPLFGQIESLNQNSFMMSSMPTLTEKKSKKVIINQDTKLVINAKSTDQAKIDEFNKNLPSNFPANIPKPILYEQKEAQFSALKIGMGVTVFGEGDITALNEIVAQRVVIQSTE
jgi:hypothetical protein